MRKEYVTIAAHKEAYEHSVVDKMKMEVQKMIEDAGDDVYDDGWTKFLNVSRFRHFLEDLDEGGGNSNTFELDSFDTKSGNPETFDFEERYTVYETEDGKKIVVPDFDWKKAQEIIKESGVDIDDCDIIHTIYEF
jgi:hypothetical protein